VLADIADVKDLRDFIKIRCRNTRFTNSFIHTRQVAVSIEATEDDIRTGQAGYQNSTIRGI